MGIDALTHRNDGLEVGVPVTHDDWRKWVSAGRTRNWMLGNPIIDWLELYGKIHGYVRWTQLVGQNRGWAN